MTYIDKLSDILIRLFSTERKLKTSAPSRLPLHEVVCMCSGNSLSLHPCPWDPLFISTTLLHTPIGSLNMVKNP